MTICPIFAMPGTERAILTKVRTCRRSVRGRVDKVVLKTFQREVEQQCRFALIAAEDMRQALQEWEGLSDEMDHTRDGPHVRGACETGDEGTWAQWTYLSCS